MTWRSAVLLSVLFALLAAGTDTALFWSVSEHYAQHGHLYVPLGLSLLALAFTVLAVCGGIALWRLHKRKAPKRADRSVHTASAAQSRATKERP